MNRTGVMRRHRLTESHRVQLVEMRRAIINIGVQVESFMVECGYLADAQRQILTREMITRQVDNEIPIGIK